ncbi:multidrug resistance-like protein [Aulographum hederae CBS 113979]|uniref:Multidrug resistance-like protein n=1 Tax=Aulographum hederae CBS 113979 TaxID=1176131 RepID=A0A6G1H2B3_9PEZI|nr:multidrug resistance-like protein [Aulographum hederae CBS 113979]
MDVQTIGKDVHPPGALAPADHTASHLAPSNAIDDRTSQRTSHFYPISTNQRRREIERHSLDAAQPLSWLGNLSGISHNFIRQILGLNPFKTSYFALFRPLKSFYSRCLLFAAVILSIAAGVPLPIIGVVFGELINQFPAAESELSSNITRLLIIATIYFAVTWGWAACWGMVGEMIARSFREALVERALGMEMTFFDVEAPDMTSILTEKTRTVQLGTSEKAGLFIQSISYFVAAFTVGFILDAKLAGILFATIIPTMALVVCFGTRYITRYTKAAAEISESAAALADSAIRAVQVVQAFGASEALCDDYVRLLRRKVRVGIRKAIAGAIMLGCIYFVAYSANALAFYLGSQQEKDNDGHGGAGTIYAVVFLILDASFVVGQFGPFVQSFALSAAAGEKIYELLHHQASHIDVYSDKGVQPEEDTFSHDIVFEDVSFVYPARPTNRVLDGTNLRIKAGTVNGIVGLSGSGKSTLAALLLRLYDPTAGTVFIGSQDLRQFNVREFRRRVRVVDQSPTLFSGTIFDNIVHGLGSDHGLSDEELFSRCKVAAHEANCDFIDFLPDGMNTIIGGSGGAARVSGGQRQKLSVARALVAKPSILILDEYTSAMDSTSEAFVVDSLNRSDKQRTTIVIAHRLATVKNACKITVLGRGGEVLEEGTHEALVLKDGVYNNMVEAQSLESPENSPNTITSEDSIEVIGDHDIFVPRNKIVEEEDVDSKPSKPSHLSIFATMKRCMSISQPEAIYIAIGLLAAVLSGATVLGESIIFGHLVQLLNTNSATQSGLGASFYCLMFFVVALVALLAYATSGTCLGIVSEYLIMRVQAISLSTILMQDMEWFSQHNVDKLMVVVTSDPAALAGLSGVIIGTILAASTSVVGGVILSHAFAWRIAIVLLSAVPVMLFAGYIRLRVLSKAEKRQSTAYNDAAALASEACTAIRTVACLGRERDVLRLYQKELRDPYKDGIRLTIVGSLFFSISLSVTYYVYGFAYWWGSKMVREGHNTTLQFFIVLPALLFSAQAAGQMFSLGPEIIQAKAAAQNVFEYHDQKPTIIDPPFSSRSSASSDSTMIEKSTENAQKAVETPKGMLEFSNVSLVYPSRPGSKALHSTSFVVKPGEFVCFVGRSGAGKSSTINLIERFYDPTAGAVYLDGKDIRDTSTHIHRERISLCPQEPDLFPGSISYNVGLGSRAGHTPTHEEIEGVCKQIGLHEFIMSLPEAYSTDIGTAGKRLSGGQKQRIALARALIRSPEILLLDEATSQLDALSEVMVRDAIMAASVSRTTIMVCHRLSSVQKMRPNRILVFDEGTIVEQGSHDELMALGGKYAGMVNAQMLT